MQQRVLRVLWAVAAACLVAACAPLKRDAAGELTAARVAQAPQIDGQIEPVWDTATPLDFASDWQGKPSATRTRVRSLWTPAGLYLLWELEGAGLRNTDHTYPLAQQRDHLYREDCVELFIAPNPARPHQYAEIETGPYGHFLDLWIDLQAKQFQADWSAGVQVAAQQDLAAQRAVIEVLITAPEITAALVAGARLPIGLYRLEGAQPRQYLAAFPTRTLAPNFHVPDAFGTLVLSP